MGIGGVTKRRDGEACIGNQKQEQESTKESPDTAVRIHIPQLTDMLLLKRGLRGQYSRIPERHTPSRPAGPPTETAIEAHDACLKPRQQDRKPTTAYEDARRAAHHISKTDTTGST